MTYVCSETAIMDKYTKKRLNKGDTLLIHRLDKEVHICSTCSNF